MSRALLKKSRSNQGQKQPEVHGELKETLLVGNDRKHSDLIIIGTGVAGLVTTCEALDAGMRVTLLDQENENNLGGQAHWSFGGLFLVDSPGQHRLRVKDSSDLAGPLIAGRIHTLTRKSLGGIQLTSRAVF